MESLVGFAGGDVVSLVGRIDPTKGHRELLAILPDLLARRPGLRVAFVGAEHFPHLEFAEGLRQELAERALERAVTFAGFREDAVELIAGAWTSWSSRRRSTSTGMGREGFPYVGLEAMAVGTPVVGYAHGGLPEMLGECGLLVPPGDRTALRHAILDVLESDEVSERLARCGRRRMQERFSLAGMVEAMKARYLEAADERP